MLPLTFIRFFRAVLSLANSTQFAEELFENKMTSGLSLREAFPTCRWVFPSSQTRYSTVFQEDMQEWFDVYSLTDPTAKENLQSEGLRASFRFIRDLVWEEAEILPEKWVILLGLSQGCAIGTSGSQFYFATLLLSYALAPVGIDCAWQPLPLSCKNLPLFAFSSTSIL